MKLNQIKTLINGKIAILGFGKEGKSALKFLQKLGAKNITICDKNDDIDREEGVNYVTGDNYLNNLKIYDLIIKSPGISPYYNNFEKFIEKITSPTEIFCNNYPGKVIGITGTKGKSTISTVLNLALQSAGFKTKLVGNIGTSVLDEVDILNIDDENLDYDYVIYEMSSYMLDSMKPEVYVGYINNIYDCHLDWHYGRENYQNAKLNVLKYAKHKIANSELEIKDNELKEIEFFGEGSNIFYKDDFFWINGEKVLEDKNILLNGPHNRTNICGILAILKAISSNGIDFGKLLEGLKNTLSTFSGLPYRIEDIGNYKGITFINDAMATTPNSTMAAVNTFGFNIGVLFLGGQDSGFQFDELAKTIKKYKIPNLVILQENIGEKVFPKISDLNYGDVEILDLGDDYKPNIFKIESLEAGVKFAFENSKPGQVVLLSTGSPFIKIDGVWKPYFVKGDLFRKYVVEIGGK